MLYRRNLVVLLLLFVSLSVPAQEKERVVREYYDNGSIKLEYPVNEIGKPHGVASAYNTDGSLAWEKTYENGALNGPARWYHANGTIHIERTYRKNQPHGLERQYSEDGRIMSEKRFVNGAQDGESREYYTDGKVQAVYMYKDNEITQISMFNVHGVLESMTSYQPDKSSVVTIYHSTGEVMSKGVYANNNELVLTMDYERSGKLKAVKYRQILYYPSSDDLINYISTKDPSLKTEELKDLDREALTQKAITMVLSSPYEKKPMDENDYRILFDRGLLLELISKVETTPKYEPERQRWIAIVRLIAYEINDISVDLIHINLDVLMKKYEQESSELNQSVENDVNAMKYGQTPEEKEKAKTDLLTLRKIAEKASEGKLSEQDLAEVIDNGFLREYLDSALKIEDSEARYKKLVQVKQVVEDLLFCGMELSKPRKNTLNTMMKQLRHVQLEPELTKIDRYALRTSILLYFKKPTDTSHELEEIVDAAYTAFLEYYYKEGTLDQKALAMIYTSGGIYDYYKEKPGRDLEVMMLAGMFICINTGVHLDFQHQDATVMIKDFENYAVSYNLPIASLYNVKDFRELRQEIRKLDTRLLKWRK